MVTLGAFATRGADVASAALRPPKRACQASTLMEPGPSVWSSRQCRTARVGMRTRPCLPRPAHRANVIPDAADVNRYHACISRGTPRACSPGTEVLDGNVTRIGVGAQVHALLGVQVRVGEQSRLVLEAQWIQAGPASMSDPSHTMQESANPEDVRFTRVLKTVARWSDVNLTGVRILVGVLGGSPR